MHKNNKKDWKNLLEDSQGAEALWNLTDDYMEVDDLDTDLAWSQLNTKRKPAKIRRLMPKRFIYGAVAASLALLAWFVIPLFTNQVHKQYYANQADTNKTIKLEDHSKVTFMSAQSALHFKADGNTRTAELQGDAQFDISHNDSQPFYVNTKKIQIKVVGTRFNVSSTGIPTVEVFEGHVKVRMNDQTEWIDLKKGDKVKVFDNKLKTFKTGDEQKLRFNKTQLSNIIEQVQDIHGFTITIPKHLRDCVLTADFSENTEAEIATTLGVLFNAKVELTENQAKIYGGSCQ